MKSLRLLIIFSLFCTLSLCAGKGFYLLASEGDAVASASETSASASGIAASESNLAAASFESAAYEDPAEDYERLVRSNSFVAANTVTNIAEHRVPTQTFNGSASYIYGGSRGSYNLREKRGGSLFSSGLKASSTIISYAFLSYHKVVSALGCSTFSKCYVLALGRLLC